MIHHHSRRFDRRAVLSALAVLALTSGCSDDAETPTAPEASAAVASVTTPLSFSAVTTGGFHSCGLTAQGRAYCWGLNNAGQLGDNTTTQRTKPVPVAGGLSFVDVNAGESFTCAITAAHKAYCWGLNDLGQLGDGTLHERHKPTAVLGGLLFRQIRPGSHHTCGVTTGDKGYCWGSNEHGKMGIGTDHGRRSTPTAVVGGLQFQRISAGGGHTCGLTTAGKAYCWGGDNVGQVGDGHTALARTRPTAVLGGLTFAQIATGESHSCGVTTNKRAYCWGDNSTGAVGDGTTTSMLLAPTAVSRTNVGFWNGVSALSHHTCGVSSSDQHAWCWGQNIVAPASTVRNPSQESASLQFKSIGGGLAIGFSCGVITTGKAYCWGGNNAGQLGDGTTTPRYFPGPVEGP